MQQLVDCIPSGWSLFFNVSLLTPRRKVVLRKPIGIQPYHKQDEIAQSGKKLVLACPDGDGVLLIR